MVKNCLIDQNTFNEAKLILKKNMILSDSLVMGGFIDSRNNVISTTFKHLERQPVLQRKQYFHSHGRLWVSEKKYLKF